MSHHDGVLADQDGASFLSDLNAFIAAYLSRFSGTTDPATLVAFQQYIRTDLGVAYRQNAANSGKILDDTLAETFVVAKSATFSAGLADFKRIFICTGTWDATFAAAATLGDGWFAAYKNNGAGTITFNPNGTETIDGSATLALAAGQSCIVYCDGANLYTIGVLGISQTEADARYPLLTTARQSQLSAEFTVAANALTVSVNPCVVDLRSATLTTGLPNTRPLAAAASLVVPSGATLGTTSAVQARLIAGLLDNAGTLEPFIINLAGGVNLDGSGVISTTAISTGADSANVAYSTTARSNVPYVLVGACDITEATAGTWATAPSAVIPSAALATMSSLGYGQARAIFNSTTRAYGTTYYNNSGKPKIVRARFDQTGGGSAEFRINGTNYQTLSGGVAGYPNFIDTIIQPGESYGVFTTGVALTWVYWNELG